MDGSGQAAASQTIWLKDYSPYQWIVEEVRLTFRLAPSATRVIARIVLAPNPASPSTGPTRRLFLHGDGLKTLATAVDGQPVTPEAVPGGIALDLPDRLLVWESEVEIDPAANTALEGLYMSRGMYCTQCEAEGFRRITWYPDRPDVMAPFSVRLESDQPVLLSNGNPVASGPGWAEWVDPWPKPAYLFALVAGDLVAHVDSFTTRSGRDVRLAIWVRPEDLSRCAFAMEALKASMAWDETAYGREYDLDVFNIVAVDDFNAGAMENKGLNIFNAALVLASPETATDTTFERIEAVIAHEYFHNWTGNRITCRDWFQLSLKEGLTVFRDQQFTGDMRSHAVKRIEDAILLRARQFREDGGPLAHPVRPESFVEINNFYTVTVYEKGAELIGMLKRLVGDEGYARALDLYFDRHDGQAATVEDWLAVFEEATGRDLGQFKRWYAQAGTPRVTVTEAWEDGTFSLTLAQSTPPTPGQPDKAPFVIPVAIGLLNPNGDEVVPTTVLELTEAEQTFRFEGLAARPIASILRGFSAPVILDRQVSETETAFLFAHDTDPFNRWEAGRSLARAVIAAALSGRDGPFDAWVRGLSAILGDPALDPAYKALVLSLPAEDETARDEHGAGRVPDPAAIHAAHHDLRVRLGAALGRDLAGVYDAMGPEGPYRPDAAGAGRRALRGAALALLTRSEGPARAARQFAQADNMTDTQGALSCLLAIGQGQGELSAFYDRWKDDRLVMDRWFSLQVAHAAPGAATATAARLAAHPAFEWKNPNRFRAVFGALAGNQAGFHNADGAAYDLMADWIIRVDGTNQMLAARMSAVFETWSRWDTARQTAMRAALARIAATPDLSRDTAEMVARLLG
jgi:aminopeptidase N